MSIPGWRTPNYQLDESVSVRASPDNWEMKTLPQYIFVRPIDYYYLPQHVKEDSRWSSFDSTVDVFIHCAYGIFMVPKKYVRKV